MPTVTAPIQRGMAGWVDLRHILRWLIGLPYRSTNWTWNRSSVWLSCRRYYSDVKPHTVTIVTVTRFTSSQPSPSPAPIISRLSFSCKFSSSAFSAYSSQPTSTDNKCWLIRSLKASLRNITRMITGIAAGWRTAVICEVALGQSEQQIVKTKTS